MTASLLAPPVAALTREAMQSVFDHLEAHRIATPYRKRQLFWTWYRPTDAATAPKLVDKQKTVYIKPADGDFGLPVRSADDVAALHRMAGASGPPPAVSDAAVIDALI